MNLLAAAWKLSLYQVWNRKRRWSTLALLALPLVIIAGVAAFQVAVPRAVESSGAEFYQDFVTVALGTVLVPFLAVFWGSAVVADEIEGKTLVYLWTRPLHRGVLLLLKLLGTWAWLALATLLAVAPAYVFAYRSPQTGGLANNLPTLLWDWRALVLGGITYSSIGFLLSFIFRKPLVFGLLIAYAWEIVPAFAPGFLRRLSVRQHVMALVTHKVQETGEFARRFVKPEIISEGDAIMALAGICVVCLAVGVFLATQREFLSDDPARTQ